MDVLLGLLRDVTRRFEEIRSMKRRLLGAKLPESSDERQSNANSPICITKRQRYCLHSTSPSIE
jgi:hypothetical protein